MVKAQCGNWAAVLMTAEAKGPTVPWPCAPVDVHPGLHIALSQVFILGPVQREVSTRSASHHPGAVAWCLPPLDPLPPAGRSAQEDRATFGVSERPPSRLL